MDGFQFNLAEVGMLALRSHRYLVFKAMWSMLSAGVLVNRTSGHDIYHQTRRL
jgi:hypothetical protein